MLTRAYELTFVTIASSVLAMILGGFKVDAVARIFAPQLTAEFEIAHASGMFSLPERCVGI
jgi:hypothetical protein